MYFNFLFIESAHIDIDINNTRFSSGGCEDVVYAIMIYE